VRDLLGHASIITTERYDNQTLEALQAAVERLEGGKTFDSAQRSDRVSSFFQDPARDAFRSHVDQLDAATLSEGPNMKKAPRFKAGLLSSGDL